MTHTPPPSADIPALVRELRAKYEDVDEQDGWGTWREDDVIDEVMHHFPAIASAFLAQEQQIAEWRWALEKISDEKNYGSDDCDYQSWLGTEHRFVSGFAKEALAKYPKKQ